jgi:uncharacterized delta-60 repeat protein
MRRTHARRSPIVRATFVESLEDRKLLSFGPDFPFDNALRNNVLGLSTGVQQFLENTHKAIFDNSFATKLPLIGDSLKSMKNGSNDYIRLAINELGRFNTDLSSLTAAQSAEAFQNALNNLAFLNQYAPTVIVSDQGSSSSPSDGEANFIDSWKININIKGEALGPNAKLPFDLGLPVFDLKLNGQLKASLKYDFKIPLVIDRTGFWFDTSGSEEFKMTLAITAPNTTIGGSLIFLKINATDAGSALTGNLKIDIQDRETDNDERLYLSEIPAALPKIFKKVELTGDAKAYLDLAIDTSLPGLPQQFNDISNAPTMPRVSAQFRLDWSLPQVDIKGGNLTTSNIGASPVVRLNNVSLDLGTTANKLIIPAVQRINTLLTPLRQVFDMFDAPVELLSKFAPPSLLNSWGNAVTPDSQISLLEGVKGVTETIFPDNNSQPRKDLALLLTTRTIIRSIETTASSFNPNQNSFALNLGSFQFGQTVDVRNLLPEALRDPGNPLTNYGTPTLNTQNLPGPFAFLKDTLSAGNFGSGQGEAGFKFPIIDQPLSVFGLLLGRPVDLVTFTTPKLSKEFTFNYDIPLAPLPITIKLDGAIGFDTQWRFGYDTWGLQSWGNANFQADQLWRLLDGFYVADTNPQGVDIPEFEVRAGIRAGVALGVPGASIGVGGGIRGVVGIDLDDPNNDGKLRPSEIVQVVSTNPLCLFRLNGEILAGAYVFGSLGPIPINFPIVEATIAKFTLACPPPPPPVPLADLASERLLLSTVSSNPSSSARNFSVDVRNAGLGNAGASTGRLVVSDDSVFDASDTTLSTVSIPALNAGTSTTLSGQVNLPRYAFPTDNQFFIGFIADVNDQVNEENEENNATDEGTHFFLESALPIGQSGSIPPPLLRTVDLTNGVEASASLADELIGSRDLDVYRVNLTANGQPIGIDINSSLNTDTYIRVYDANWNLVAQNDNGLSPSDNLNFTPSPNRSAYVQFVPPSTGLHYVVVGGAWNLADARTLTSRTPAPDGDELRSRDYRIRYLADPFALPDLRVRSISQSGNFNFITAVIANEGQAPANWTDVRFYLSDDATVDTNDVLLSVQNTINFGDPNLRLNPGQTVTINVDLTLTGGFLANADPFLTDNEYFLGAFVDTNNWINESSKANNANQGIGTDQLLVRTEVDLGTVGSGVVNARPLAVNGLAQTGTLGDELIRQRDTDIYSFNVDQPGRILRVQVSGQFQSPGVRFDPYVSIFDSNWKLVARSDIGRADVTIDDTFSIAIDNIYKNAGTYFVVVSHPVNGMLDPRTINARQAGPNGLWNFSIGVSNPFPARVPGDTYEDWNLQQLTTDRPGAREQTLSVLLQPGPSANSFISPDGGKVSLAAYVTGAGGDVEVGRIVLEEFPRTGSVVGGFISLPVVIPQGLDISGDFGLRVVVDPDAVSFETQSGIGGGSLTFDNTVAAALAWDVDLDRNGVVTPRAIAPGSFITGSIGDELSELRDQDIFSVALSRGRLYTVNLGTEAFGAAVSVFDSAWNLVGANVAPSGNAGTNLTFIAPRDGTHYIVVSSRGNSGNDPRALGARTVGEGSGTFFLSLTSGSGADAGNFIGGTAFRDLNDNGLFDEGEPSLIGVGVWIDLNNDGVKDLNEPTRITDDQGRYLFDNLSAGVESTGYTIRVLGQTGFGPRSAADAVLTASLSRFGDAGAARTDFGSIDTIHDSILLPDGRLVVVGSWDGGASDFAIARYMPDGTLDPTFGGGFVYGPGSGLAHYAFSSFFGGAEFATSAALQPDGKLVVVGYSNSINNVSAIGGNDVAVIRLNTDGSLDTGFGTGGRFSFNLGFDERATSVALDGFGGIIIGGTITAGSDSNMLLLKLTPSGQLDPFFGPGGSLEYDEGGRDVLQDLHIDAAGRIVVAGYSDFLGSDDFVIARFTFNGQLDNGFGVGGRTITNVGWTDRAYALTFDAAWDRYLLAGEADGGLPDFAVVAYTSSGMIDTSFNGTGTRLVTFGAGAFGQNEGARDILLDATGGYFVAGYTSSPILGQNGTVGQRNFAIAKLTPAGSLDTSFNGTGLRIVDRGGSDEIINTLSGDFRRIVHAGGVGLGDFVSILVQTGDVGPYATRDGQNFAFRGLGAIDGFVAFDVNDNGYDNSDHPLASMVVFIDLNGDGVAQDDEPLTVTDSSGYFLFDGLRETSPGEFVQVRFVVPEQFQATGGAAVDRVVLPGLTNRWVQPFVDARHIGSVTASLPDAMRIDLVGGQLDEILASNVTLTNSTTGQVLTASQLLLTPGNFTSPSSARSLALTFRNTGNPIGQTILPDGQWLLEVSGFADGQTLRVPFDVVAGDANGDRAVDFADLLIVAQNYGMTGRTFSQGNFDYSTDGLVGFNDLLILAQRYGTSLIRAEPKPNVFGGRSGGRRGFFRAEDAVIA